MGPADTLSRKDEIETSDDNHEIMLLKGRDQYFHIRAIDATLAKKISSSSTKDPIITKALAAMNHDSGEPWIPQMTVADWEFIDNSLYFKHHLYIPESARHDLVRSLHESPAGGHEGFFRTFHRMQKTTGGQGCLPFSINSLRDVLIAKQPRRTPIPWYPDFPVGCQKPPSILLHIGGSHHWTTQFPQI